MPQRSVRFPDDLHAAIEAEAAKRGHPHTFSSVLLEWATKGRWVGTAGFVVRPSIGDAIRSPDPVPDDVMGPPVYPNVSAKPVAARKPRPKGGKR